MFVKESVKIGERTVTIETGRVAKQANGSVIINDGDTVLMVTVCGSKDARPGQSFFPLSCDYVEKTYAAGKIPGGFFKREARQREHEILTSRLIDRPCRPLFPEGFMNDVQVVATVLSQDTETPADILALVGASAALHISDLPWDGPIAGCRVGRVNGQFIANPTYQQLAESDCDLIVAASKDAIVMVEGEAEELTEEEMTDALFFGHQAVQGVIELIENMREAVGKEKWTFDSPKLDETIVRRVREVGLEGVKAACNVKEKHPRYAKMGEVKKEVVAALASEFPDREGEIKAAYEELKYHTMRAQVLDEKRRVDGRDFKTVRPIAIEAGWLPRTHGSALFTRGETQSIVTTTLGTAQDEQKIDGLVDAYYSRFLLHYNFPPYSVGETKPLRGPGRREIGHGNLAHRALSKQIPSKEEFPYTIRIVSEITESNGSSSMATVCGGSLAMMDAGVPVKNAVAGVAMGLIKEGDKYAVLTDILGDEDHLGDMDFKVCGTEKGITAIQMDIKIDGLSKELMKEAMTQAREGRLHILGKMNEVMAQARPELSKHAPRITTIKVKPDQIRVVIGPGGKMIKAIVEQTGAQIDLSDDGTVSIASSDSEAVNKAIEIIRGLTTEPEVGAKYKGTVRRVERYGAFIEIAPGKEGLLHISDFAWGHVDQVEDHMNLGDEVEVVVSNIDRDGKVKLSRKELLPKPEGYVEREERDDRGPRRGGRDRDRDRDRGDRGDRGPRRDRRDRDDRPRRDRDDRPRDDRPRDDRPREDRPRRDRDDRDERPRGEGDEGEERRSRRRRRRRDREDGGEGERSERNESRPERSDSRPEPAEQD